MKLSINDILPSILDYYKNNPVGGCLHLVLENGNIENKHILVCLNQAQIDKDTEAETIASKLLQLSKTQRHKIYKMPKY